MIPSTCYLGACGLLESWPYKLRAQRALTTQLPPSLAPVWRQQPWDHSHVPTRSHTAVVHQEPLQHVLSGSSWYKAMQVRTSHGFTKMSCCKQEELKIDVKKMILLLQMQYFKHFPNQRKYLHSELLPQNILH